MSDIISVSTTDFLPTKYGFCDSELVYIFRLKVYLCSIKNVLCLNSDQVY